MGIDHNPQPYTLKTKKTLIQKIKPRLIGIIFLILAVGIIFSVVNEHKDDHQLLKELIQDNRWGSMVHLSAALRLCQNGNEVACKTLKEYEKNRNAYIPRISQEKTNTKLADLYNPNFTKSEISKLLYNVLKNKYTDLDGIFEAGLKEVKKVKGMTDNLIQEIKWLLLEKGYDPTDWQNR